MKAVFVQVGQAIDFIPSRDIGAGEILVCNGMAGVVKIPVKSGELGALHLSGIYDIQKKAEDIPAGSKVYFDTSVGLASLSGDVFLGVAAASSLSAVPKIRVILNFGHPDATGCGSSDSIQWLIMN